MEAAGTLASRRSCIDRLSSKQLPHSGMPPPWLLLMRGWKGFGQELEGGRKSVVNDGGVRVTVFLAFFNDGLLMLHYAEKMYGEVIIIRYIKTNLGLMNTMARSNRSKNGVMTTLFAQLVLEIRSLPGDVD
jgi:hypothetical protein